MRTPSPIEVALFDALGPVCTHHGIRLAQCFQHAERKSLEMCDCLVQVIVGDPSIEAKHTPIILVCREAMEFGYHVDFLLRMRHMGPRSSLGFDAALAVECDGHDYHERNKQQAAQDRARDRELLIRRGLVTIRFTGSEIYRDANQCARECVNALLAVAGLSQGVG